MNHQLPAGLTDSNGEFFTTAKWEKFCITGGAVIPSDRFPAALLAAADNGLSLSPKKERALPLMTGSADRKVNVIQFLVCNYGGFDNEPDMVDGVLQAPEYCPCPKRGSCRFEGIVCDPFKTDTGNTLSSRELQVVRLIGQGNLDKHIAHRLHISIKTVTTHTRNIRRKAGLERKADIARFAHQKNLLA